jgi:hypothetical protein
MALGKRRLERLIETLTEELSLGGTILTGTRKTVKYITAAGDQDYSALDGDTTIIVNVALADTNYIRLPEATTSNGGMHIKVLFALPPAENCYIGFVTTNIVGGWTIVSDGNEGKASQNPAYGVSVVGDAFLRAELDVDGEVAKAGGAAGTTLDFYYTGAANVVIYRGLLIGAVDSATGTTHLTTTAVNA